MNRDDDLRVNDNSNAAPSWQVSMLIFLIIVRCESRAGERVAWWGSACEKSAFDQKTDEFFVLAAHSTAVTEVKTLVWMASVLW